MEKKKIVLIGAGSAMFTQGLVFDLMESKIGIKWQLALVDIDPKALEIMRLLCEKMLRAKGSEIELMYSTDRRDVLKGADFVVSTIAVGGRRAWEQDVIIPRKYDIFQPVGDSVGPGGISRAMRMIPAIVDITKDIIKFCPDAYFFNYANPMTTVCRAVRKSTGFPIIGLCHGVKNGQRRLARFAGLDPENVSGYAVGINHFVILYDFRYKGKNVWPLIKESIRKQEGAEPGVKIGPLSRDFIERYTAYPVSDDRHYSEFEGMCMLKGNYYGKTLGIDVYSFERTISWGDEIYQQAEQLAYSNQELPQDYFKRFEGEHEQLIEIICSIYYDERKVFSVNIPNEGSVLDLPWHAVLEMPAVATGNGFVRMRIDNYPTLFSSMIAKHLEIAELTVEAALQGDRNLFLEAVLRGGYIINKNSAAKMVDELLRAQKQYLPQFA